MTAKPPIEPIDLRSLSRDSDKIRTVVRVYFGYDSHPWMELGAVQLRAPENTHLNPQWVLSAYLKNATDFEHDSAHVLRMELIGVTCTGVRYGRTHFDAWIKSDAPEDFNVPSPGYNPLKHADTDWCEECEGDGRHAIVPEGFYVPPTNLELYEKVRGRRVEIITGIAPEEET